MNLIFKSEILEYDYLGHGESTILLLHGWGGNKDSFKSTINLLKNKYKILAITMPTTKPTNEVWTLQDYSDLVLTILNIHNTNSVNIICHSFGFRVAIFLKEKVQIQSIIITGGAGPKKTSKLKKIQLQNLKTLSIIKPNKFSLKDFESEDYSVLNQTNKTTFKNIVNFNLIHYLKFNCPMLLFWGKKDISTKIWIAKLLKKQNKAKLITTNSDHFAYLKLNTLFNHEVINFLERGNIKWFMFLIWFALC